MDLHTHLREPGREDAETVESGTQAAALGGFTAVHAMANTDPVADTAGVVEQVWRLGREAGYCDVYPVGAVTVGLGGERLAELGAMADSAARVRVFSDDGKCVDDAVLMRRALEYVKAFDGVVAQHAQEPRLTENAQMNEGELSGRLGLAGWPAVAEEAIIARDCLLAAHVGSRLHVCHVSTAGSVEIVRQAKEKGWNVTAEVCPHHLLLTDELATTYDPIYKVNPPLRTAADAEALRAGLADGTIDIVATDHAPHPLEDKDCEWAAAAFGMLGLETALSIVQETMVDPGLLDWAGVAERMSHAPARIGRVADHGRPLEEGAPANVVLYDPSVRRVVEASSGASLSRNTPYAGMELPGPSGRDLPARQGHRARREASMTGGALLVLEDGRTFHGEAYGAEGETFGEAVFNTGMTGYQETLTDPSYHRQVVVMTAPHIGNTGVNDEDPESRRIWVAGYVVRDPARVPSNWRSRRSLDDELRDQGVVGISGVDTRALTRHLRERGAMRVGISSAGTDPEELLERVRASAEMAGAELAGEVSTDTAYVVPAVGEKRFTVAALDLGIKSMTPALMAQRGIEVHVLPATASLAEVQAVEPDGLFFSNGPGDPAATTQQVELLRGALEVGLPYFGICFGNQLFGRALGFGTYKLKYGHRGINQPVMDRTTGKVEVTAHNHGFAVDAPLEGETQTPYGVATVSHVCLNDDVVEGLELRDDDGNLKSFSVQYHPEAAAGPHDAAYLFDRFVDLMGDEA